jgi:phenylacetate-CoA ligase
MNAEVITDRDRYPTLSPNGHRMLQFLREHPQAPIFRNESGNRLKAEEVQAVLDFERKTMAQEVHWRPGSPPAWLAGFVERCYEQVPFYRRYGSPPFTWAAVPAISRADLSRDIAAFVPDHTPIDRLINYRTSGTTGHPLLIASHPEVAARYLVFHKRALRRFGIELRYGRGQVGVVLVGYQRHCFTYVSVTPTMDECGLAKINLHPSDWRHPDDRAQYLDALAPELYTGDPISFAELAKLPLQTRPRALLSTSMALSPGLRRHWEKHFDCPVVDIYSLNEAGPVAVADPATEAYAFLQPEMYVEIVGPDGTPLPPGESGEVTLTGGFNFCLPLLRYRTGDQGRLEFRGPEPWLTGLQGRPPVRFRTTNGEWLNNIEVTHAFQSFAMPQFSLHQFADARLRMRATRPAPAEEVLRRVILELFGPDQRLEIEFAEQGEGKIVQYTSELAPAETPYGDSR